MIQTTSKDSALRESSDLVIPAVQGEFYRYSSKFTEDRSLYVFMKCKANKAHNLAFATELGRECNLVFLFGDYRSHVCSIRAAHSSGLLGNSINGEVFGETWVAPASVTPERFHEICSRKDVRALVEICRVACAKHETSLPLELGLVVAVMTDVGKYGMFLVTELVSESISIDACHILL